MKIKIGAKDLQKRLDILSKVAKTKTTLPILQTYKMVVSDDLLTLTASDLEVTIVTRTMPEEIKETGSVCVLADKFTEVIKNFKDCTLELSLSSRQVNGKRVDDLIIKSKSGKFKIPCQDAEDYPQLQEPKEETQISIGASTLVTAINKTLFATHHDLEFEPALCGIKFDFKSTGTTIVATNKVKVALCRHEALSPVEQSVVLTKKVASYIPTVFSDGDEVIEMSFDDRSIKLNGINFTLYGRLSEGNYPDYQLILNHATTASFVAKTEDFIDSIKRAMIFCETEKSIISLSANNDKLYISGENIDFNLSADEEIDLVTQQSEGSLLIHGRYLLEILTKITTETIEVSFADTHPVVFFKPVDETKQDYLFGMLKYVKL
jgi:DNA polymerase-3 subunit beta